MDSRRHGLRDEGGIEVLFAVEREVAGAAMLEIPSPDEPNVSATRIAGAGCPCVRSLAGLAA